MRKIILDKEEQEIEASIYPVIRKPRSQIVDPLNAKLPAKIDIFY